MGIPMSLMRKMGIPGMQSLSTDKIFDQFFTKEIRTFDEFHKNFLDVCNKLNSVMLGKHYIAPTIHQMEEFYKTWKEHKGTAKEKKEALIKFLTDNISISQTDNAILFTGLVAPPAAMALKKAGDNVPQLKRFRLNLIPDFIFVPSVTVLAVIGAKVLRMSVSNIADAK